MWQQSLGRTTRPQPQSPAVSRRLSRFRVLRARPCLVERQHVAGMSQASTLALRHHEQPPEGKKRLARGVLRVGFYDPLAIGCFERGLLVALEDIEIPRQPGPL